MTAHANNIGANSLYALNVGANDLINSQKQAEEKRKLDILMKDLSGLMGLTDDVVNVINKLKSGAITGNNGQVYNPNQPGTPIGINPTIQPQKPVGNTGNPPKVALIAGGALALLAVGAVVYNKKKGG